MPTPGSLVAAGPALRLLGVGEEVGDDVGALIDHHQAAPQAAVLGLGPIEALDQCLASHGRRVVVEHVGLTGP